jgi:hypothetical protein
LKQFLERNANMISWISGIGIPGALIFVGWLALGSVERSKLDSEYVRIALNVLSAKPTGKPDSEGMPAPTEDEMALRKWAVRLLNGKSPEKFSTEEQSALLRIPVDLSSAVGGSFEAVRKTGIDQGSSLVSFNHTVVAEAEGSSTPSFSPLNLVRPTSLEFGPENISVRVLSIPPSDFASVRTFHGTPVRPGDVLSIAVFESLGFYDRTHGVGGKGEIKFQVSDPRGSTLESTVTLVLKPRSSR